MCLSVDLDLKVSGSILPDHMLKPQTLDFLRDLAAHNDRDWFQAHRAAYEAARGDVLTLIDRLIERILDFDPSLQGLVAKDCLFRINRDTRFSQDKAPYKTNFGAAMGRGGRRSAFASYYLHIAPAGAFIGGGVYMPPSDQLGAIRRHIDREAASLRAVLADPKFRAVYGDLDREQTLKTAPKGYDKDHPDLDLLRLKSFTAVRTLAATELTAADFLDRAAADCEALSPLIHFLNDALAPA